MSAEHQRAYRERLKKKGLISMHYKKGNLAKFGLSLEDYNQMINNQQGKCAICGISDTQLCVDHDHSTGKVRGLLCHNCNHGIGKFQDDIKLLNKAINYLKCQSQ